MNTAEGGADAAGYLVHLYDELPLRRAELAAFLSHWAALERVGLVPAGMPDSEDGPNLQPQCRMVVFSIGSLALDRSPALGHMLGLTEQHQEIPTVVLAEAGGARDAAVAFQAGASGYIPASIEPEIALRALSFILHGGHFFPPTALQTPRAARRGGGDDGGSRLGSSVFVRFYRLRTDRRRALGAKGAAAGRRAFIPPVPQA